ncbi:glycosyltransferase 87 family protein [Actinoplanes sp. URMC 104]|uniref:glycosyltransferase 87 family protein n=1 Tax=Actinoplanes sp. URMC 104 TaxID=3423409 RepID=UPI003F1A04F6
MGTRRIWLTAGLVAAATAGAALAKPVEARLTDLSVYLGAVGGLADGASLYDFTRGAAPFTYPPFAALLFTPLTWLPVPLVQVAWTLATLAVVAALAALAPSAQREPAQREPAQREPAQREAARREPAQRRPAYQKQSAVPLAALALMLSAPVASNLKYGQVSLFLAALIVTDFLALRRTPWHGALIGLAAAVKLTPLIFIPLLWFAGRRAAAAVAGATFAGCALLAVITLPGDSWRFWTGEVFHVSRLGHITGVGNQSLNGALLRLGVATDVRSALVLLLGGAVAGAALVRAVRLARKDDWFSAMVVVGAASVVLSPVSWTHHQIWLVMAALLPVPHRGWRPAVLALMLLPVTAVPLLGESRLLLAIAVAAVVPLGRQADAGRCSGMRTPRTSAGGRRAVTVA